jgi:hypothetical protein
MKRTATSSERSSTGVAGRLRLRLRLDGRFLEYERQVCRPEQAYQCPTEQVESNRTVEGKAAFEGL